MITTPLLAQITNQFIDQYLDGSSHSSYDQAMGYAVEQHCQCNLGRDTNCQSYLAYLGRYIHRQSHEIHYALVDGTVNVGSSDSDLALKLAYKGVTLPNFHLHKVNSTTFVFDLEAFGKDVADDWAMDQEPDDNDWRNERESWDFGRGCQDD